MPFSAKKLEEKQQVLKSIPFSLLPPPVVLGLAKGTKNAGNFVAALFPSLGDDLLHARLPATPREYAAVALIAAPLNAVVIGALLLFLGSALNTDLFAASLFTMIFIGAASFATIIFYPKIIALRRVRLLEKDLIPATRQLIIELKSGVPLFNALASVSSDYGEVSAEFRKMVTRINNGVPELDALAEASHENPSFHFRKVLWQISNALKVGSDVGTALEAIVEELTRERVNEIRRYGQELSPWTMLYMMAAVVVPSLGITMMIVISSFMSIQIPKFVLPAALVFLVGFQLFFANFVASRRPNV